MYHTGGISEIGRLGLISKNNGRARELEPLLVKVRNEATRESNLDKGGKPETDSASTARLKGDREMSQTRRKAQDARRRCHMSPPPKWSLSPPDALTLSDAARRVAKVREATDRRRLPLSFLPVGGAPSAICPCDSFSIRIGGSLSMLPPREHGVTAALVAGQHSAKTRGRDAAS
ncbi:hypothetical protein MRX96_028150 [Rhipicephalus microplus]